MRNGRKKDKREGVNKRQEGRKKRKEKIRTRMKPEKIENKLINENK